MSAAIQDWHVLACMDASSNTTKLPSTKSWSPQQLLGRRVSNKDDLGNALFILSPRFRICFVTNVHDCMKDMLEGVVLDSKDAFYSEDGAWKRKA